MERVDVRGLGTDPVSIRWTGPADLLGLGEEPGFAFPVTVDVRARRLGTRVLVEGRTGARVRLICSRCLEEFEETIDSEVAVEFREGPPPASVEDTDGEGDAEANWFEPPFLDLADDIRQVLLVASPSYPVCRESCRGLCPVCGANRNEAACGHPVAPEAPRTVLGALMNKEQMRHG